MALLESPPSFRTRGAELLEEWILTSGLHYKTIASQLGVAHTVIRGWRTGDTQPDESIGRKIAQVTRGAVPVTAWREPAIGPTGSRDQRRSRRVRAVRCRTISIKRMTKREIEIGRLAYPEDTTALRPKNRSECVSGHRPCPFVSCKYHLYLDVQARTGAIKLNFPDLEVEEMKVSCVLDVADRGGATLEEAGAIMNLTRERVRQLEVRAMAKLEALRDADTLRDFVDEGPIGKRRLPVLNKYEIDDEEDEDEDDEDEDDRETFGYGPDDTEEDDDDDDDDIDWGPHGPIDPLDQLTSDELEDAAELAEQTGGITKNALYRRGQ